MRKNQRADRGGVVEQVRIGRSSGGDRGSIGDVARTRIGVDRHDDRDGRIGPRVNRAKRDVQVGRSGPGALGRGH